MSRGSVRNLKSSILQITRPDRSSLMAAGFMRVVEPIAAGEHFSAAPPPQCRIPERRRRTKFKNFPPHLCYFADRQEAGVAAPVAIESLRPCLVYLREQCL